jgi:hypothetical protein
MAERRQELRFHVPLTHSYHSQFHAVYPVSRSFLAAACGPRIVLASSKGEAFGTAGKGSPASGSFTNAPILIAVHRIYTIALYVNYPIQSYEFYFFVSRQDVSASPLEMQLRTPG